MRGLVGKVERRDWRVSKQEMDQLGTDQEKMYECFVCFYLNHCKYIITLSCVD